MSWCTIESDPAVFTELVETLGVEDVEFRELLTLEAEEFERFGTVHGVVFLFQWRQQDYTQEAITALGEVDTSGTIFFAKQTVHNACATQAIINGLLNSETVKSIGPVLTEYRDFAAALPAEFRGDVIGNNQTIRAAHNSFTVPDPFISTQKVATDDDDDDVFHFISFVPIGDKVYELDGLKEGPIAVATIAEGQMWFEALITHLQTRIARYAGQSIKFNLMAMTANRLHFLQQQLAALQSPVAAADGDDQGMLEQVASLSDQVQKETKARATWKLENHRRRHNYIPFIMKLLGVMAESGDLKICFDETQAAAKAKLDAAKAKSGTAKQTKD